MDHRVSKWPHLFQVGPSGGSLVRPLTARKINQVQRRDLHFPSRLGACGANQGIGDPIGRETEGGRRRESERRVAGEGGVHVKLQHASVLESSKSRAQG